MVELRSPFFVAAIVAAVALSPAVARADDAVVPPVVVEPFEPETPAAARNAGAYGDVVMRLDVSAEGAVTRAEVTSSSSPLLEDAARDAASHLRFTPAQRGERPIAARILYRFDFRAPPPPPLPSPVEAPAPAPVATPLPLAAPAEVTVRGVSEADRMRESALAVNVIETKQAQREAADLGEVLARNQGLAVQRDGGLGSSTRFSLNGLTDDQVRFFLDGVPLELAGYPWGIANVPVNLVQRVEVYRGVVPIRFGADALGGAVNLVTDQEVRGTHGGASYQIGSFGTHRATALVHTHDPTTGLFARASGYFDHANNDYPVEVDVPNALGQLSATTIDRFHDRYQAFGVNAEAGFVRRPWAKKLLVRAFITEFEKDLQNNPVMTVPYGEATYERLSSGISARYEHVVAGRFPVDVIAGYTFNQTIFRDLATCVYDWFGQCGRARPQPGEIESKPHDQAIWDKTGYARVQVGWKMAPDHAMELSVAPTYTARTGDERRPMDPSALDPQTADRRLFTFVSGVEETSKLWDDRVENILFLKDYFQLARAQDPLVGSGTFQDKDRTSHRVGFGDSIRYRFTPWLYAKASYEWATRLPSLYEVFGDGVLVVANLGLAPEVSHNGNLGITLDTDTRCGNVHADTNFFLRSADDLIVLLGNERQFSYQNVYGARAVGVEAGSRWTSPGDYLSLDANVTYQDFRNTEDQGTFGKFEGDRIPNRPYLFANASARVLFRNVAMRRDELSFVWNVRYVHEFFRSWESAGALAFKPFVPAQLLHGAALTYLTHAGDAALTFTAEAQNLTDQRAFDFYGVQRPGRAFYFKTTFEL